MEAAGFEVERIIRFNRITRPGWFINGRLLKKKTFSPFQLAVFDRLVWLWRIVDGWLPWRPVSIIAVARKPLKGSFPTQESPARPALTTANLARRMG
jgi:hypothetical protein